VVTASVAADTSAVKSPRPTATAVRQTPLTATLPPTASGATCALPSSMTKRASAPVFVRDATRPMPFTNPENTRSPCALKASHPTDAGRDPQVAADLGNVVESDARRVR